MTAVASSSRPRYAAQYDSTVEICVRGNIACHRCGAAMIVASSAPGGLGAPALKFARHFTAGVQSAPIRPAAKPHRQRDEVELMPDVLLQRCELLAQRLDILLVEADRLPQLGEPVGIFLRVLLFLGQWRWCAVAVGRASFDQQFFLGVELVGQDLVPQTVAPALCVRVHLGKSGRRRRGLGRGVARLLAHAAGKLLPALFRCDIGVVHVAVGVDVLADVAKSARSERERRAPRNGANALDERATCLSGDHGPPVYQTPAGHAPRNASEGPTATIRPPIAGLAPITCCNTCQTRPDAWSCEHA